VATYQIVDGLLQIPETHNPEIDKAEILGVKCMKCGNVIMAGKPIPIFCNEKPCPLGFNLVSRLSS